MIVKEPVNLRPPTIEVAIQQRYVAEFHLVNKPVDQHRQMLSEIWRIEE